MASGSKISQFTELVDLVGDEEAVVAKGGANYKFKLNKVKSLISKSDLGLDQVDNTSDEAKPVSEATQTALDEKAEKVHTHTEDQVEGLTEALAGKAATVHTHTEDQVEGLTEALDGKAPTVHEHSIDQVEGLADALNGKAPSQHGHTISQVQGLSESLTAIEQALQGKAPSQHDHSTSQIQGLDDYVNNLIATHSPVIVGELQW